jgi:hypothetical protein
MREVSANYLNNHGIAAACRLHTGPPRRTTMKKSISKLAIHKQTVRTLATSELAEAAGGWIRPPISWSCPQPGSGGCPKDVI